MKVLAIGNSFSEDATRYLHQIAKADGTDLTVMNMFIGGCPLRRHYMNMLTDEKAYTINFNGQAIPGLHFALKEVLVSNDWDVVTLQQSSSNSGKYETYQPYLDELAAFVRKHAPQAKLMIHQTWSYEDNSAILEKCYPGKNAKEMYNDLKKSYRKAAKSIDADGVIYSGKALQKAREKVTKVHRDCSHASLGFGRYLLGLVWYKTLTGKSVTGNTFADFAEPIEEKDVAWAQQIAESVSKYK